MAFFDRKIVAITMKYDVIIKKNIMMLESAGFGTS